MGDVKMSDWKKSKKYHGLSLEEIKARYYIDFTGEEDPGSLKYLNGKISKLWQDVAFFYNDTNSQLKRAQNALRRIDEQLEYEENKAKWKYITENKVLPKNERWTDSARSTAAFIETRTDKLKENLNEIRDAISDMQEEAAVWHEVRQNLRMIASRVDNASMNMAVEAKLSRSEPGNIPKVDEDDDLISPEEEPIEDAVEKASEDTTESNEVKSPEVPF